MKNLEEFKAVFRKTPDYEYMSKQGCLHDEVIFFVEKGGFRFAKTASAYKKFIEVKKAAAEQAVALLTSRGIDAELTSDLEISVRLPAQETLIHISASVKGQ